MLVWLLLLLLCHKLLPSLVSLEHSLSWEVTSHSALQFYLYFSQCPPPLPNLRSKHSSQHSILNALWTSYTTSHEIIIVYILICTCVYKKHKDKSFWNEQLSAYPKYNIFPSRNVSLSHMTNVNCQKSAVHEFFWC